MVKRIPERKCAGCAETKKKNELIRIVRSPEGEISIDLTGKKSGRGVYICNSTECFNKAFKKKRLESSLKCPISNEIYESLLEYIKGENS